MILSDILLRIFVVFLATFLALTCYRTSVDPDQSTLTRCFHEMLAKRYVRGPQIDPRLQAKILSVVFLCIALLALVSALSGA